MSRNVSRFAAAAAAVSTIGALAGAGGLQTAAATPASALPTVTVTETGTTISVGGTLASGAVNVVTTTSGEAQGAPVLFALRPGATAAQLAALLAQKRTQNTPDYVNAVGSIVFDASADRGVNQTQTVLAPGNYVALDTTGSNPTRWPTTTFTVAANPSPATLDAPQATISAIEFGFQGPRTLRRGALVRVENRGFLVHMFLAFPVRNASRAAQLTAVLKAGRDAAVQKLVTGPPIGLAGPLSPGAAQQSVLNAAAGYYVLVCFMDTQDGREHTRLGMERTIRVVG